MLSTFTIFDKNLEELSPNKKLLINTINAHSYNVARKDKAFRLCLQQGDILIPDGVGIILALRLAKGIKLKKIAGADLFQYEMERLQKIKGKCFFLGSSEMVLQKMKKRAAQEYPDIRIEMFSPPYKAQFSASENQQMCDAINAFEPDVLFVGMTAPKQEKWAFEHYDKLNAKHIGCIGAVFDFYAGTVKRAPQWLIKPGLEWMYRFGKEPRRMWKRYLIGNTVFLWHIFTHEIMGLKKR